MKRLGWMARAVERIGKALGFRACDECDYIVCQCRRLAEAANKQRAAIRAADERARDFLARQRARSVESAAAKLAGVEQPSLTSRLYGPLHPIPEERRFFYRHKLPRKKVRIVNRWRAK